MARRRTIPDPARAHGAWVFLILATAAGVLTAIGTGAAAALGAGASFAGVFVFASGAGARRPTARLLTGALFLAGGAAWAISRGAPPSWLVFASAAVLPVGVAGYFARRDGFRSSFALAFAVVALALAAPAAACAGGATPVQAGLLLALLAPPYAWRAVVTGRRIASGSGWTRPRLRRQGYLEATYALGWTILVVVLLHAI